MEEQAKETNTIREEERCDGQVLYYRAEQVSMSQPRGRQVFGGPITQIMIFRAIQLKSLSPIQLTCNREVFNKFV